MNCNYNEPHNEKMSSFVYCEQLSCRISLSSSDFLRVVLRSCYYYCKVRYFTTLLHHTIRAKANLVRCKYMAADHYVLTCGHGRAPLAQKLFHSLHVDRPTCVVQCAVADAAEVYWP